MAGQLTYLICTYLQLLRSLGRLNPLGNVRVNPRRPSRHRDHRPLHAGKHGGEPVPHIQLPLVTRQLWHVARLDILARVERHGPELVRKPRKGLGYAVEPVFGPGEQSRAVGRREQSFRILERVILAAQGGTVVLG